jgi:tetratricopeptide (TPR) repeat protein
MSKTGPLAHLGWSLSALVLVGGAGAAIPGPPARPILSAATPPPQVFSLAAGPGCPRRLPPGGDVYEIDLPADTYLHAAFDQEGTDVAVTVFAPGPRRLYRIDSPNGAHGSEEVHLVSGEAGQYRFEVTGPPGDYCPRLRGTRRPSLLDRRRAAADRDLYLDPDLPPAEKEERYRRAIPRLAAIGDRWHQAAALHRLARLLRCDRGGETIALLTRAEALFAAAGDRHLALVARLEKGQCQSARLDFDPALETFEGALALARETGEVEKQAIALHELGLLLETRGEAGRALEALRDAVALWQTIPGPEAGENEANSRTGLGAVYASIGDWQSALAEHRRAFRLRKRFSPPGQQAISALQIGATLRHTTPFLAATFLQKAWKLQSGGSDAHDRAATLNGLGLALADRGRHQAARTRFREALRLYGTGAPDRLGQATTAIHLGATALELGAPGEAFQWFQQALELCGPAGDRRIRARALLGQAEVEIRRRNLPAARKKAGEALALYEQIRAGLGRPELETSYRADNVEAYRLLRSILQTAAP